MKKKLLKQCLDIALINTNQSHSQWNNFMHFSFFVQDNKIIGWGTNRTGCVQSYLNYPSYSKIHAEVAGYKRCRHFIDNRKSFEVVNVRTTKTKQIRQSDPCKCCSGFLQNLNCKRVWFTTKNGMFANIEFDIK